MKTRIISLLLLLGVTWLGFQIAYWTDWDKLPSRKIFAGPITFAAHIFVLSTWTLAWLLFWKSYFGQRGRRAALSVCLFAAVLAELMQAFLHGHVPDWFGFFYNLTGVLIGACVFQRYFGTEKAFAVAQPE